MKNNKIILSVGSDDRYLNNIHLQNYLKTINENSNFDRNILTYLGEKEVSLEFNNIEVFRVDPKTVKKLTNINCLQHGEFLNSNSFDEFSENDVIVYTDGDMTLQRSLSENEILFLKNLNDNDVFIGYNKSPEDTLHDEYFRLSPRYNNYSDLFSEDLTKIKVYNTGVVAMNKKTWNKLKTEYIELFDKINSLFGHYAKQQWLICYLLFVNNYNVIEMGYEIHNHTHYPSPQGTTNENGLVKFNNSVVLFKHKWF